MTEIRKEIRIKPAQGNRRLSVGSIYITVPKHANIIRLAEFSKNLHLYYRREEEMVSCGLGYDVIPKGEYDKLMERIMGIRADITRR